ncbi:uncharacterized protein HGUI_02970 [Hanseniaspora guilliermondii]|uniref:HTH CENPB-type domain-containing protein n=1 Tax=Hanseniaspora guilliermondii TaxID=56406 RepID=A0A1L0B301_9ASCO|nr:uncharacterized protein HGUI_02970 [Hanseniaspora guilliermondii]
MLNTSKQYSENINMDNQNMDLKLNRATLEQKLAIVLFFKYHKDELPRFKLVNMLNKKISISISSLSSWLKNEQTLREKYMKMSQKSMDTFNFNQIIQDILNSDDLDEVKSRNNSISLNNININKDNPRNKYIKINKMMDDLVMERKQKQLPITESILKSYWIKFYPLCNIKDPKRSKGPSNGWLDNFKNKHELKNYGNDYNFELNIVKSNDNRINKGIKNKPHPLSNASTDKLLQNGSSIMYDQPDSNMSHQSALYITKPSNKYDSPHGKQVFDDKVNLKPQSMNITTSEKTSVAVQAVPLTATASMNTQDNIRNTINMQSRIMASQTDLLNALKPPQQESTDSFFKKFGSGIFNFNNASSKDLENVNAFFQQQKQNQSSNNENFNKNDSTSILSWFKNTAIQPQQKIPSTGMSFLNLSQYNKREDVPSSHGSENLSNRDNTLYNEFNTSRGNDYLRQQVKSEPVLKKDKRLSKILSGETFNEQKNKDASTYLSDDSDSDGGLEINVSKNFTNEQIDVLLNVHVYNFLNKNQTKYIKSLEKFREFMDAYNSEK